MTIDHDIKTFYFYLSSHRTPTTRRMFLRCVRQEI